MERSSSCPKCGVHVTTVDLWLVPVTPPGPWVDACSAMCARSLYEHAVSKNVSLDNVMDTRLMLQRDVKLNPPKLRLDAPDLSDLI